MTKDKVKKKKTQKKKSEKVCEVFEVKNKKGKEKVVKTCGNIAKEHASKKENKEYNKILRNFFIGILVLIFFIIGLFVANNYLHKISFEEIEFQQIKQGQIQLFYAHFPVSENTYFNLYLRNNPEKLNSLIEFNGNLTLKKFMVIHSEEQFYCDGYGIVSVANLNQFYNALGVKVVQDENATCDKKARYTYVNIKPGNKTEINQYGPSCYDISISDCEILKGTERFILEGIKELKKAQPFLFE